MTLKAHWKYSLVVTALLLQAPAFAAIRSDLQPLQDLIESGNKDASWSRALALRARWESDPEFDLLYATAALANQQPHEAMFALERVVAAQPGNVQARYLLAQAYEAVGDHENARQQFAAVQASNPPPAIRRDVENRLGSTPTGKPTFNGFVETLLGHDNNVNSATGSNRITPPSGLQIELDPKARKTSDMYGTVLAGIDYFHPLDNKNMLEVKGRYAERDNFSSDTYDSNLYRASIGLRHQEAKDLFRVTFTAHDFRLSDSDYQRMTGLSGDWVHQWSSNIALLGNIYMNALRYPEASRRDINQYIGHAGVQVTNADLTHTIGLMLGNEDSPRNAGSFNARDFTGIYYDLRYAIAPSHQLYGRIFIQDARFNGEDPTFLENRQDVLEQLTLGHSWQINRHWRWKTELGYSDSKSDVNFYSFERTYIQTGVRYSF